MSRITYKCFHNGLLRDNDLYIPLPKWDDLGVIVASDVASDATDCLLKESTTLYENRLFSAAIMGGLGIGSKLNVERLRGALAS